MKTEPRTWTAAQDWSSAQSSLGQSAQLVLISSSRSKLEQTAHRAEIRGGVFAGDAADIAISGLLLDWAVADRCCNGVRAGGGQQPKH
jgi:hypothetical protein